MLFKPSSLPVAASFLSLAGAVALPATTAASTTTATKIVNHPIISPTFAWADLDASLKATLPTHSYVSATVTGRLPTACVREAAKNTLQPTDFKAIRVQYEDCGDSWVFCVHKDAPQPASEIINTFGQLPVGYRSYMQTPIAVNKTYIGSAYTRDNVTVVGGPWIMGTLAHEIGHILDHYGFSDEERTYDNATVEYSFSHAQLWKDAVLIDTGLPNKYGSSAWQEDFAEISRLAFYDLIMPGGLRRLNWKNTDALLHQIQVYEHFLGRKIFPSSGKCERRIPEPEWQDLSAISSFARVGDDSDEPDAVKEILEAHKNMPY